MRKIRVPTTQLKASLQAVAILLRFKREHTFLVQRGMFALHRKRFKHGLSKRRVAMRFGIAPLGHGIQASYSALRRQILYTSSWRATSIVDLGNLPKPVRIEIEHLIALPHGWFATVKQSHAERLIVVPRMVGNPVRLNRMPIQSV